MTTVGLLVVGDGREGYLKQCVDSLQHLDWDGVEKGAWMIHDDTGTLDYRDRIGYRHCLDGPFDSIVSHAERLGMAGAVRAGWEAALEWPEGVPDYLFHIEEDFVILPGAPPIRDLVDLMERHRYLAEVTLRRQPWSPEEHAVGRGFTSNDFRQCSDNAGVRWVQQDVIFSLNPSLIPRHVLELGWPDGNEAAMTRKLFRHTDWNMGAFWGWWEDPISCEHIGHMRSAGWRL